MGTDTPSKTNTEGQGIPPDIRSIIAKDTSALLPSKYGDHRHIGDRYLLTDTSAPPQRRACSMDSENSRNTLNIPHIWQGISGNQRRRFPLRRPTSRGTNKTAHGGGSPQQILSSYKIVRISPSHPTSVRLFRNAPYHRHHTLPRKCSSSRSHRPRNRQRRSNDRRRYRRAREANTVIEGVPRKIPTLEVGPQSRNASFNL